jgi:hypothetical protein
MHFGRIVFLLASWFPHCEKNFVRELTNLLVEILNRNAYRTKTIFRVSSKPSVLNR